MQKWKVSKVIEDYEKPQKFDNYSPRKVDVSEEDIDKDTENSYFDTELEAYSYVEQYVAKNKEYIEKLAESCRKILEAFDEQLAYIDYFHNMAKDMVAECEKRSKKSGK